MVPSCKDFSKMADGLVFGGVSLLCPCFGRTISVPTPSVPSLVRSSMLRLHSLSGGCLSPDFFLSLPCIGLFGFYVFLHPYPYLIHRTGLPDDQCFTKGPTTQALYEGSYEKFFVWLFHEDGGLVQPNKVVLERFRRSLPDVKQITESYLLLLFAENCCTNLLAKSSNLVTELSRSSLNHFRGTSANVPASFLQQMRNCRR